jgi:hypothetical protein
MPPQRPPGSILNSTEKFSVKRKGSKFPLPDPIELAKLAAILRPEFQPAGALEVAMQFYVEAVFFCQESSAMSFEDLIARFGSEKRHLALMAEPLKKVIGVQWADNLELDPGKDDDPARQFLAEQGLHLKRAQSVLDNFRRYYNSLPKDTWKPDQRPNVEVVIARCERVSDGKKTYAIPRFMLESIVEHGKWRRRASKRKTWRSRQTKSSV